MVEGWPTALLTGCYNFRNGAMFNQQRPRADVKKWPAYFQAMAYEVVAIGTVAHYDQVTTYGFDGAGFYKYHEDVCIEKAVEWLAGRKSDKPLCLLVGTNWPHVPWPQEGILSPDSLTLPAKIADTPETRLARTRYAAAVDFADRDLGLVRAAARRPRALTRCSSSAPTRGPSGRLPSGPCTRPACTSR